MKLLKTVVVEKPLDAVFGYLSDFTTTTDWDPGTVTSVQRATPMILRAVEQVQGRATTP